MNIENPRTKEEIVQSFAGVETPIIAGIKRNVDADLDRMADAAGFIRRNLKDLSDLSTASGFARQVKTLMKISDACEIELVNRIAANDGVA